FAMSSDNASSTVTYTSVSFGPSEPSAWGISLVNAGEIPDVDPYEESNAEDALPTIESPGYSADSDPIENDTDADSIDYPDEPGTDDEDSGYDDDEDPEEDPSEKHESEDEQDSDETEPFEEDETVATPPSPGRYGERVCVRP
ncbi:hypothetical protein Tco_0029660, partial [Tanacetum coccineum]